MNPEFHKLTPSPNPPLLSTITSASAQVNLVMVQPHALTPVRHAHTGPH